MEIVDKLDNKRQFLRKTSDRSEKIVGEFRQSAHTWIMNSEGKFLMQKRSPNKKTFPNMWSQNGGGVDTNETPLQGALRECKEELGITIPEENIELILSFKRKYDFVDVWLAKMDIEINNLVLQKEEVSEVQWFSVDDLKLMLKNNKLAYSIEIYFDMFINLLNYSF